MIKEAYCSFEVAKLLKEKGFNEKCFALYNPNKELIQCGVRLNNTQVGRVEGSYGAPTHQMAMAWLREEHNIHILLEITDPSQIKPKYYSVIWKASTGESFIIDLFDSYEEGVESALEYTLENLIKEAEK